MFKQAWGPCSVIIPKHSDVSPEQTTVNEQRITIDVDPASGKSNLSCVGESSKMVF